MQPRTGDQHQKQQDSSGGAGQQKVVVRGNGDKAHRQIIPYGAKERRETDCRVVGLLPVFPSERNWWQLSRVNFTACLPFLIHCSAAPGLRSPVPVS
jgi:hypothetical protein